MATNGSDNQMDSNDQDNADARLAALQASLQEDRARTERAIQESQNLIQENQLEVSMAQLGQTADDMREEMQISEDQIRLSEEELRLLADMDM